jgi:hypothetical protein
MKKKKILTKVQQIKNLNFFLRIGKIKRECIKNSLGIKFLTGFFKNLFLNNLEKSFPYSILVIEKNNHAQKFFTVNSLIRFFNSENKIKAIFFKNFPIQKNLPFKISIEESVDEIKIYLDENLIQLAIKYNPFVGRCWLSIKSDSVNNKKFWHQFVDSCFNFMTGISFIQEKPLSQEYIEAPLEKKTTKDHDFEYSRNYENKIKIFLTDDQLINYKIDFKKFETIYKTVENRNYLKKNKWRNRIFTKKESTLFKKLVSEKIGSHSPNLLLS